MSRKYKFHNKSGLYFVSFATVYWIDVFTREKYLSILSESISYCRKTKKNRFYKICEWNKLFKDVAKFQTTYIIKNPGKAVNKSFKNALSGEN